MKLVYLSRADVEDLGMTMRDVLQAVDQGFASKGRGKTEMPPKPGIHTRPDCFIHAMPAYVRELEVAGLKWVSGYPPTPLRGCPTSAACLCSTIARRDCRLRSWTAPGSPPCARAPVPASRPST